MHHNIYKSSESSQFSLFSITSCAYVIYKSPCGTTIIHNPDKLSILLEINESRGLRKS